MKTIKPFISKFLFFVFIVAVTIYSCKKDLKSTFLPNQKLSDSVNSAKTWYETTYPLNTNSTGSISTNSVGTKNSQFNFSQHVKPDWGRNASYRRLGKSVIEIPLDAENSFSANFINKSTGQVVYSKENSRSSFIVINDGKKYEAFIMTVLADASYIGNDQSKLEKNTYRKRDANFTGLVLYFRPDGTFVRAYRYTNGKLLPPSGKTSTSSPQQTQGVKVSSPCDVNQNIGGKSVNSNKQTASSGYCVDWYLQTYLNGVLINEQYLYTTCYCSGDAGDGGSTTPDPCTTTDDGGDDGGGGSRGGGGGVGFSLPKLIVNDIDDGSDDGGMGDPVCESCAAEEEAFFASADAGPASTFLGIDGDVDIDPTTGDEGRTYKWTFLRNSLGTFHFDSGEYGTRHWDGTRWVWATFVHDQIYPMAGWVIGGTVSVTGVGAHATIGQTNAIMALTFGVTKSFICNGSPFTSGANLSAACTFDVNATPLL